MIEKQITFYDIINCNKISIFVLFSLISPKVCAPKATLVPLMGQQPPL